jgi:hypothetical protein
MGNSKGSRRRFGSVRRYRSGRWTASYLDPSGQERRSPETFDTKADAEIWLSQVEADLTRGDWQDPDAGAVNFEVYAVQWVAERELSPTTEQLYGRRCGCISSRPSGSGTWMRSRLRASVAGALNDWPPRGRQRPWPRPTGC